VSTRLLFIGHKPHPNLGKLLATTGITVESQSKITGKEATANVIIVWVKTMKDLEPLVKLRARHAEAWIVLVSSKSHLSKSPFQTALLSCEEKDEVWVEESWEVGFWLSLQRILKSEVIRHAYNELSRSSDKLISQLEKDVGLATNIQRALLPKFSPEIPGVSVAVKYLPAAGAGGDYYDIFEFGDKHRFGVLLADSKTHGMAAALLAVLLKVRLEELKDRFPDTRSFIEFINREFQSLPKKDTAPLSLLYGILDRSNLVFHFTVAGPIRPLLWRHGRLMELTIPPSPELGTTEHFAFIEQQVRLQPGDLLVLHTDGLAAPLGKNPRETLERIIKKKKDPLDIQNEILALVDRAREKKPLPDDVTIIHFAIHARALYVAQSK